MKRKAIYFEVQVCYSGSRWETHCLEFRSETVALAFATDLLAGVTGQARVWKMHRKGSQPNVVIHELSRTGL
jgi:hypothetical protein